MEDLINNSLSEVKKLLSDPKNKQTALVSTAAYILSKDDKERNALVAGLLAYLLIPETKESK